MESTMVLKIIIGLIIFLYALRGMRKGFIRTLMSMAFLIMAAVLVYFANPTVSSFLKEKTPVYDVLEDKCRDIFSMKNLSRLSLEDLLEVNQRVLREIHPDREDSQ